MAPDVLLYSFSETFEKFSEILSDELTEKELIIFRHLITSSLPSHSDAGPSGQQAVEPVQTIFPITHVDAWPYSPP